MILARARDLTAQKNLTTLVFTFDPHPTKVLKGDGSLRLLQSREQKLRILKDWGFSDVLLFPFTHQFSMLSPRQFMEEILLKRLKAAGVVVGTLFNFGHDRKGNADTLKELGDMHGFSVIGVPPFRHRGHVVSSTWIRTCLSRSDLAEAEELLGRPYAVEGEVVLGDRRGTGLGFPTANIAAEQEIIPPPGVYLTLCFDGSAIWSAMTNIGFRPTFGEGNMLTIESHLLGFNGDLYGKRLEVFFLAKKRDEINFESVASLRLQLEQDRADAFAWFASHPSGLARCRPALPPPSTIAE